MSSMSPFMPERYAGRRRCCRRSTSGTGSASGTPSRSACGPGPGSTFGAVEVLAVVEDLALDARRWDQVVHPVEAADQRALAAARRTDQRRDVVLEDVQADVRARRGCRRRRPSTSLSSKTLSARLGLLPTSRLRRPRSPWLRPRWPSSVVAPASCWCVALPRSCCSAHFSSPTISVRIYCVARSQTSSSSAAAASRTMIPAAARIRNSSCGRGAYWKICTGSAV